MSDSRFQRRPSPAATATQPASASSSEAPASPPAAVTQTPTPRPASAQAKLDGKGKPMSPGLEAYIARYDELDLIDIRQVARLLGCVEFQDNNPNKWKMPDGANYWFFPNSQGWKDLNNDQAGKGAVRLVRRVLEHEKDRPSMDWLSEHFTDDGQMRPGVQVDAVAFAARPREEKQFRAAGNFDRYVSEVMEYLSGERGIPPSLLRQEIKAGRLYATRRDVSRDDKAMEQHLEQLAAQSADALEKGEAVSEGQALPFDAPVVDAPNGRPAFNRDSEDWKTHCAFVSRTAGELRSVEKKGFKGTMPGSQSDEDVTYTVPHQKPIAERLYGLVEAAVDSQSYGALFPGRINSSTNGAYRFSLHLKLALEVLTWPGFGVRLAFDADEAGDLAAQRVFNALYASKAIANRYKIEVEDVEEWFLNGNLKVDPDVSPHTLFFGTGAGYSHDLQPVHVKMVDKWTDEAGKKHIKARWPDSGNRAHLTVTVRVNQPVGPLLKSGEVLSFRVMPEGYAYVVNELDVRRDRPIHAKDWNEELLRLGSSYVRDYERCAEEGFTRTPKLPADMEAFRNRAPWVIPPPAPAAVMETASRTVAPAPAVSAPASPPPVAPAATSPSDRPRFQRPAPQPNPPAEAAQARGPGPRRFSRP